MATSTTEPSDRITPVKATGTFKPTLWTNSAYIAEQKLDGVRATLYSTAKGSEIFVGERNVSAKLPQLTSVTVPGLVLDGELVLHGGDHVSANPPTMLSDNHVFSDHEDATVRIPSVHSGGVSGILNSSPARAVKTQEADGFLTFYAFDCLHVGRAGRLNLRTRPWTHRRAALVDVVESMSGGVRQWVKVVTAAAPPHTRAFYRHVVALGGEGVVLKHREQSYTGVGWVKVKFRTTLSVVITGINRDRESVAIAVYDGKKLSSVGDCGIKNTQLRAQAQLKPHTLIGRVLDVQAYAVSEHGKLRNPIWDRLRPDLFPKVITREKLVADFEQAVEHA